MNYTNLGKTGLQVSRICLGCMSYGLEEREWGLDEEQGRPFIKRALGLALTFLTQPTCTEMAEAKKF